MSTKRVSEMTDDEIRDLAGVRDAPEYAVRDTAERAAEAVRLLNYLTLPGDGAPGLEFPSDIYDIVARLKTATQRMPQLLGQMSGWLAAQEESGRVAHDSGRDALGYVTEVRAALAEAAEFAGLLEEALNRAHNASSGLKAA